MSSNRRFTAFGGKETQGDMGK